MADFNLKIIIPGAAGLVGQNLIILLKERGYRNIVAIDQHPYNLKYLRELHPDIEIIQADVSKPGEWIESFEGGDVLIMLQAQITSKTAEPFVQNNIVATKHILEASKRFAIPYIVHISSSVVISVADDDYTRTKTEQEEIVINSGFNHCVLRPTLMFGWFDRKHLGWLSRFMKVTPVFPIPGDGKFMRQPLYVKDFCRVIIACMEQRPDGGVYNITGKERIDYVDIIRTIKRIKKLRTFILHIPMGLFYYLLKLYAVFSKKPPFTADQLKALTAGDQFPEDPWWKEFDITPTPFDQAMWETHHDARYSSYILKR
ncbi:NAD-dependent epimerase/dehydratase family protein [Cohnella yongneupensis]|uniref:NAD-dependent epimerase/dehydratase family protein n=1 Tax=Cohnella yongneupensis TaxID=425006 RepID=A0ABW0QW05_9BACL